MLKRANEEGFWKMRLRALPIVFAAAGLLLFSCGGEAQGDPQEIAAMAATAMSDVESLHFNVDLGEPGLAILPGMTASSIEGDAAQPDRVQAEISVVFSGISVALDYRAIGDAQYVTSPLDRKAWQSLPGQPLAKSLLNPSDGVSMILSRLTDLELVGTELANGVESHRLKARIPNAEVAAFFGSPPQDGVTNVELWIGVEDSLVRKVILRGPSLQDDPTETERTIEFSKYGEPVDIVAPI